MVTKRTMVPPSTKSVPILLGQLKTSNSRLWVDGGTLERTSVGLSTGQPTISGKPLTKIATINMVAIWTVVSKLLKVLVTCTWVIMSTVLRM